MLAPACKPRRAPQIEGSAHAGPGSEPMKNPLMSMWMSAANKAIGTGRGLMTAEMRRQQSAAAKKAMQAAGLGPKKKAAKKKRGK